MSRSHDSQNRVGEAFLASRAGLAPLVVVAAPMGVAAWVYGGSALLGGVAAAVGLTLFIALASDWLVRLAGIHTPVERLLAAMGVRGASAAAILLVAIKGLQVEPKLAVLVAAPLYLSLIAGEVLVALRLTGADPAGERSLRGEGAC